MRSKSGRTPSSRTSIAAVDASTGCTPSGATRRSRRPWSPPGESVQQENSITAGRWGQVASVTVADSPGGPRGQDDPPALPGHGRGRPPTAPGWSPPTCELTYAEALERIERAAGWLRAAGVGPGDRVVVTARNHARLPAGVAGAHGGRGHRGADQPEVLRGGAGRVRDPGRPRTGDHRSRLRSRVVAAPHRAGSPAPSWTWPTCSRPRPTGGARADVEPDDVAVMIPTSGTTGRSKLVMQTHRAYVMAGEGFPFWMQLTADDRLMTSLPLFHINAPAYSTLGSVAAAGQPGAASRRSRPVASSTTPAGTAPPSSTPSAPCSRSCMRQPERPDDADNPLRLCYTGPVAQPRSASSRRRAPASASSSCAATGCRSRPTG